VRLRLDGEKLKKLCLIDRNCTVTGVVDDEHVAHAALASRDKRFQPEKPPSKIFALVRRRFIRATRLRGETQQWLAAAWNILEQQRILMAEAGTDRARFVTQRARQKTSSAESKSPIKTEHSESSYRMFTSTA